MNRIVIMGNLTKDPELRQTGSGVSVCTFSVAASRRFKNSSGEREADFLNIVTWRGLADNCYRYLKKGNRVAVSGSIQTRSYEASDGSKRYAFEVVADDVEFINVRADQGGGKEDSNYDAFADMTPASSEDLPF